MRKINEKELVIEFANFLKANIKQIHPTKFLVKVIEEVYGHRVEVSKLITLIETSPLPKRK